MKNVEKITEEKFKEMSHNENIRRQWINDTTVRFMPILRKGAGFGKSEIKEMGYSENIIPIYAGEKEVPHKNEEQLYDISHIPWVRSGYPPISKEEYRKKKKGKLAVHDNKIVHLYPWVENPEGFTREELTNFGYSEYHLSMNDDDYWSPDGIRNRAVTFREGKLHRCGHRNPIAGEGFFVGGLVKEAVNYSNRESYYVMSK